MRALEQRCRSVDLRQVLTRVVARFRAVKRSRETPAAVAEQQAILAGAALVRYEAKAAHEGAFDRHALREEATVQQG